MEQSQIDQLTAIAAALATVGTQITDFIAANPVSTDVYTPTEAEVQASVDAGVIASFTPKTA